MDCKDAIKLLAERISKHKELVQMEEVFFQALSWQQNTQSKNFSASSLCMALCFGERKMR